MKTISLYQKRSSLLTKLLMKASKVSSSESESAFLVTGDPGAGWYGRLGPGFSPALKMIKNTLDDHE